MNPDGPIQPRRRFLWDMGAGFAGLALTSLLEADGFFTRGPGATGKGRPASVPPHPLAPKPPHRPTRAKSVIFLGAPTPSRTSPGTWTSSPW